MLIHSPGYNADRTFNTLVIEELASWGYVVVAVDHPYDSGEVEFPDGRVVVNRPDDASDKARTAAVAVRAADLRFVLDQLTVPGAGRQPRRRATPPPPADCTGRWTSRASARSATPGAARRPASVMFLDERVRAGIDLDGAAYGPVVEHGLDRPFLLMDTVVHDGLNQQDGSWPPFWAHLSDWRRCLRLADADHNCFTDIVALAPAGPRSRSATRCRSARSPPTGRWPACGRPCGPSSICTCAAARTPGTCCGARRRAIRGRLHRRVAEARAPGQAEPGRT
ncbi:hypothetical protein [Streptomyces sp. KL116D]|uniref:hypothetical protein n=1 Tax=Streptomyces sp. KL116D TaxID=3045152 RepID=UPI0035570CF3